MKNNSTQFSGTAAALWASAFVIMGLVIMQAGTMAANPAYAGMSSTGAGYTLLTVDSGTGGDADPDELLYLIDNRAEVVFVYEIQNARQNQLMLRDGGKLVTLFNKMR